MFYASIGSHLFNRIEKKNYIPEMSKDNKWKLSIPLEEWINV